MKLRHTKHRRGLALLMTLAALVLVITVAACIARLSANAAMHENLDAHSALADDLVMAAEAPIIHWLTSEAGEVVLAPDAEVPEVPVLHEQWTASGMNFDLQVTAFDQQGMAPIHLIHRGSPLRLAVSQHALDAADRLGQVDEQIPGLDLLVEDAGGAPTPIWPAPQIPHECVTIESEGVTEEQIEPAIASESSVVAVGALLATHNENALINVNTAPIALIEQAMRIAGRGGIEQIVASRTAGERATVPSSQISDRIEDVPQLVASSNCWSLRIDARVERVHRSWWAVYSLGNKGWTCVQRLAIPQ